MKRSNEPPLLESEVVARIAGEIDASAAQVLIAWAIGRATSVIPKSANPERIAQNLAAAEIELTADAMGAIDGIDARFRYIDPKPLFIKGVNYDGDSFWD